MSSCKKTVKYHPAACAMMLDHTSQSKQQKRSRPTRKQNKEPFVNTLLTIKIACAEKEWSQNNGSVFCLTACIRVWSEWFERRSYRSRHIFAQPFTTYLCLSALVSHTAQGEKQESFFNANDIAWGRARPEVEAAWMQIFHLFLFPSATVSGHY